MTALSCLSPASQPGCLQTGLGAKAQSARMPDAVSVAELVARRQLSAFIAKPYFAASPAVRSLPKMAQGTRTRRDSVPGTVTPGDRDLSAGLRCGGSRRLRGKSACSSAEGTEGHRREKKIGPTRREPQSRGEGRDTMRFPQGSHTRIDHTAAQGR